MEGDDLSDSSPATAVDSADPQGSEAFSLLGNEKRLAILLALWEAFDPFAEGVWDPTEGNTVPFSEIRERVGMRDSGQFNYHLGKLEGVFVEQTEDGYRLLPAGNKIVRTLISIAGFEDVSLEPTEIGISCSLCDAPTAITYQNQRLYHVCTECDGSVTLGDKHPSGVLRAWIGVNPVSLSQRTPEETFIASVTEVYHLFAMRAAGICPWCSGQVETAIHVCDTHDTGDATPCPACDTQSGWTARFVCTVCKHAGQGSVSGFSLHHPAVVAFFWNHGIELRDYNLDTVTLLMNIMEVADEKLVSREPPRVCLTIRHEGDEIQLTYDEEMNVIELNEDY